MSLKGFLIQQQLGAPAPFTGPAFDRLQREWYGRLEDSGFVDVERASFGCEGGPRVTRERLRGGSRGHYYRVVGWWRHDRVWPSRREARIWGLLADGFTLRETSALCHSMPSASRSSVHGVARRELELAKAHYVCGPLEDVYGDEEDEG